jgi:hypothetical protein
MTKLSKHTIAFGLAGALALAAISPSAAAPAMTSTALIKSATSNSVIDVRWRGRHGWRGRNAWIAGGLGFAAGTIFGSALAYPYYGGGYYDGPYYDDEPLYVAPPAAIYVEPGPAYAGPPRGPNGPLRQCWVATDKDRGFGYWQAC